MNHEQKTFLQSVAKDHWVLAEYDMACPDCGAPLLCTKSRSETAVQDQNYCQVCLTSFSQDGVKHEHSYLDVWPPFTGGQPPDPDGIDLMVCYWLGLDYYG